MPNVIESPNAELAAENAIRLPPKPKPTKLPRESASWRVVRWVIAVPMLAVSFLALFPF